jgi:hypothetical protein
MKKLLFIFTFTVYSMVFRAQSFHRGALVLDVNSGIEAVKTVQRYSTILSSDTTVRSIAANKNASFGLEIGLSKRFGIGARGKVNSFFRDVDAVTRQRTTINSTDLLITLNFHPVVRKCFDLIIGTDLGLSSAGFTFDDLSSSLRSAKGQYFAPYLCSRIYWKRLGFHIRTTFPALNYGTFNGSNDEAGNYLLSKWRGSGIGVSVGAQLRIF